MDHVRLHPMRPKPPRQPEAVAAGFEGKRNPRDLFTGSDCLIAPAMQQAKQPFGTRLQFLARLTLNAGKHTANQPTRLAHLDDGNDRAILVQGDEGPAQVVRLGHQGTPSVGYSDDGAISLPPAPYHLSPGGRWIRTIGTPEREAYFFPGRNSLPGAASRRGRAVASNGQRSVRTATSAMAPSGNRPFCGSIGGCACPPSGPVSRRAQPGLFAQYSHAR